MKAGHPHFLKPLLYRWLFTYKLYHLPFWFIYHYTFWMLATGSTPGLFSSPYTFKFFFYVIFQAAGVYFNLYFLIPRILEKGRQGTYLALLLLTLFCTAALIVPGYYISAWAAGISFQEAFGKEPADYMFFFKTYTLPSTLASMTLGMSVKLTKNWIQSKRREQLLEKEKLETELKFLRAQFNPHFLFNTINSIFVLIHKNPTLASEALAKFSDLLRYQLYECNEPEIPLRQELTYLEGFIELGRLRIDTHNLSLSLNLTQLQAYDLTIAPFIIIPFIENAFKHVSQWRDKPNWITINLGFNNHQLHLEIINSTAADQGTLPEFLPYKGLGLKNVQRRLDLVYPSDHILLIKKDHEQFSVTLNLNLREQAKTGKQVMQAV